MRPAEPPLAEVGGDGRQVPPGEDPVHRLADRPGLPGHLPVGLGPVLAGVMPEPERHRPGRLALGGVVGQTVVDPLLHLPDLPGREHGLDAGDLVPHPHDAVAAGVHLGDARGVQLGGQLEPAGLPALQPRLLDRPEVGYLAVPDRLAELLELWAPRVVGGAQQPVGVDHDRQAGPGLGGVRPARRSCTSTPSDLPSGRGLSLQ